MVSEIVALVKKENMEICELFVVGGFTSRKLRRAVIAMKIWSKCDVHVIDNVRSRVKDLLVTYKCQKRLFHGHQPFSVARVFRSIGTGADVQLWIRSGARPPRWPQLKSRERVILYRYVRTYASYSIRA